MSNAPCPRRAASGAGRRAGVCPAQPAAARRTPAAPASAPGARRGATPRAPAPPASAPAAPETPPPPPPPACPRSRRTAHRAPGKRLLSARRVRQAGYPLPLGWNPRDSRRRCESVMHMRDRFTTLQTGNRDTGEQCTSVLYGLQERTASIRHRSSRPCES